MKFTTVYRLRSLPFPEHVYTGLTDNLAARFDHAERV